MDNNTPAACCPHCQGTDFYVTESITYKASTDEDDGNIINCWHKTCEIEAIICRSCGEDITEDLTDDENIQFNFD